MGNLWAAESGMGAKSITPKSSPRLGRNGRIVTSSSLTAPGQLRVAGGRDATTRPRAGGSQASQGGRARKAQESRSSGGAAAGAGDRGGLGSPENKAINCVLASVAST